LQLLLLLALLLCSCLHVGGVGLGPALCNVGHVLLLLRLLAP
jgi:hypothetical protein